MEVKILCPCGAKYKFDVEPVHGQLPGPVKCPVCSADGTAAGNTIIAEKLSAPSTGIKVVQPAGGTNSSFVRPVVARSSKEHVVAQPSPTPEQAPAPAATVPPAQLSGSGARLSPASVHTVQPAAAPPVPPPAVATSSRKTREHSGPSDLRGILGAAIAGLVGMLIWTGLIIATNTEIGYAAWGVGALVGLGAKTLGRGESDGMGLAAAVAALIAILMGQFLATRHAMNRFADGLIDMAYTEHIAYAKEAVAAQNDGQIRTLLAKYEAEDDQSPNPSAISEQQISEFKKELPKLKKAAGGQVSRAEYQREHSMNFPISFILKNSFSLFTLLWIFLGVGTAYRIAGAG